MKRALVLIEPELYEDKIYVGGAIVLHNASDEDLGFAVTARPVRVRTEKRADEIEAKLRELGFEVQRAK